MLNFVLPRLLLVILLVVISASAPLLAAEKADYLPPSGAVSFAAPPVNAIADLHGDIIDPQLVVFFAGNQFMVVHDLIAAFKQAYPQYQRG